MKKKWINLLKISVSVLLLVLLFRRVDFAALWQHYANIHWGFLGLAFFILFWQTALSALKWKFILKADQSHVPFVFLWKTYLIGNFLSLFLPSSIGGDFYRIYAVRDASRSLGKSTSSVLFDRLSGVFALLSISLISSLFLPDNEYNLLLLAGYVVAIVAFLVMTSTSMLVRLRSMKIFQSKWTNWVLKIMESFNAYRQDAPKLALILLISFIFQLNIVVLNKFYTLSLGIDIPFRQLLVIIPLIYLTEVLPISINGLGVRESAFVFFFSLLGHPREEALAVSLLIVFLRYLMGSIGGTLLLLNSARTKAEPQEGQSSEQPAG